MTSARAFLPLALLALAAGCDRVSEIGGKKRNGATRTIATGGAGQLAGVTPMADRVAVIGLLNKRNGIVRDLTMKPGQAMRVKDVTVRLRACETSAPWEAEKLTGAFVQVDVRRTDGQWVRRFSGWLFKESPSLNVVEDPVYDVWPKSCAMKWPEGPAAPATPRASSRPSSAPKSGAAPVDSPAATPADDGSPSAPADSAADSNAA